MPYIQNVSLKCFNNYEPTEQFNTPMLL